MVVLRERRQMMTVSPPSDNPVGTGGGGGEALCVAILCSFMRTLPGNQDATLKYLDV